MREDAVFGAPRPPEGGVPGDCEGRPRQIRTLADAGWGVTRISHEVGVARNTVRRQVRIPGRLPGASWVPISSVAGQICTSWQRYCPSKIRTRLFPVSVTNRRWASTYTPEGFHILLRETSRVVVVKSGCPSTTLAAA
jgi:hypothetical protein